MSLPASCLANVMPAFSQEVPNPNGGVLRPVDSSGLTAHNAVPTASILLVEDNPVNQKVALLMLKKLGYQASAVANGRIAVEAASESHFDLIFMDCLMPELDGFQATQAIRAKQNGNSKVPIVAMTANAYAHDRAACFAAGMSDYLSKPVREPELRGILQKWLPAASASA